MQDQPCSDSASVEAYSRGMGPALQQRPCDDAHGAQGAAQPLTSGPALVSSKKDSRDAATLAGPCYLKLLVPNHVAGAIIGRDRSTIASMEQATGCVLRVSQANAFFPGTKDRMIILSGSLESVEQCMAIVLQKSRQGAGRNDRQLAKLAVPSSAVSSIIGHGGDAVKNLIGSSGCKIHISTRADELQERIMHISGESSRYVGVACTVCRVIQQDPRLKDHLLLKYDVELPLGVWQNTHGKPADPSAVLLRREDAQEMNKRDLIAYLQKAAPRGILSSSGLLMNVKTALKKKSHSELLDAVAETWDARCGEASDNACGMSSSAVNESPEAMLNELTRATVGLPLTPIESDPKQILVSEQEAVGEWDAEVIDREDSDNSEEEAAMSLDLGLHERAPDHGIPVAQQEVACLSDASLERRTPRECAGAKVADMLKECQNEVSMRLPVVEVEGDRQVMQVSSSSKVEGVVASGMQPAPLGDGRDTASGSQLGVSGGDAAAGQHSIEAESGSPDTLTSVAAPNSRMPPFHPYPMAMVEPVSEEGVARRLGEQTGDSSTQPADIPEQLAHALLPPWLASIWSSLTSDDPRAEGAEPSCSTAPRDKCLSSHRDCGGKMRRYCGRDPFS